MFYYEMKYVCSHLIFIHHKLTPNILCLQIIQSLQCKNSLHGIKLGLIINIYGDQLFDSQCCQF